MEDREKLTADDYTVGWICALPAELAASIAMLDERHPKIHQDPNDTNSYTFGRIDEHNVVMGCLPSNMTGIASATNVAMQMKRSFKSIRIGLMVGIGGGVPSADADIRLGDVVVSRPQGQLGGVVQYDLGKTMVVEDAGTTDGSADEPSSEPHDGHGYVTFDSSERSKFVRMGFLNSPPTALLTAIGSIQTAILLEETKIEEYLSAMTRNYARFSYPHGVQDILYKADYKHAGGRTCANCNNDQMILREERSTQDVVVHFGTIASGNQVMKNGTERDRISAELAPGGVLCFEMEAAGLVNNFPCLVIRGISDYCDSHKDDRWQNYAAATAAAFAKELLHHVPATRIVETQPIERAIGDVARQVEKNAASTRNIENHVLSAEEEKILEWLAPSSINFSNSQNAARSAHTPDTGQWLLKNSKYISWRDGLGGIMWLYGSAGCGKTILCSTVICDVQERRGPNQTHSPAYWYFEFSNASSQSVGNMLRSIIRQLHSSRLPTSIREQWKKHQKAGSQPSVAELKVALDETVKLLDDHVYIILDALDECPPPRMHGERAELLDWFKHLLAIDQPKLHLLVTSRPEPDIRRILSGTIFTLNVEIFIYRDVERHVQTAVESLTIWMMISSLTSLQHCSHSKGHLQIKHLRTCPTRASIDQALRTVPKDLEATYRRAFDLIDPDHRQYVREIMIWLALAFKPLSPEEVAGVVAFVSPDFVLEICSTLLVTIIDTEMSTTIKLAHFSVKEFLIIKSLEDSISWYQFPAHLGHGNIAARAIQFLLAIPRFSSLSLLYYSAWYWTSHAERLGKFNPDSGLQSQIDILFDSHNNEYFRNWVKLMKADIVLMGLRPSSEQHHLPSSMFKESVVKLLTHQTRRLREEGACRSRFSTPNSNGKPYIVQWVETLCKELPNFFDIFEITHHMGTRWLRSNRDLLNVMLDHIPNLPSASFFLGEKVQWNEPIEMMELSSRKFRIPEATKISRYVVTDSEVQDILVSVYMEVWSVLGKGVSQRFGTIKLFLHNMPIKMSVPERLLLMTSIQPNRSFQMLIDKTLTICEAGSFLRGNFLELDRADLMSSEKDIIVAMENAVLLDLLLDQRLGIAITNYILESSAWGAIMNVWFLLLDRQQATLITENVSRLSAESHPDLKKMVARWPAILIVAIVIKAAAKDSQILNLLQSHRLRYR